ncbi:MAG: cell volume regulation protein A [Candidatus Woesearchaeota archaeon]
METTTILTLVSAILLIGFLGELIYKKFKIPDIIILIAIGVVIGPHVLGYVHPEQLLPFAPIFTTVALLMLIFDGAFNMDLASVFRGFTAGFLTSAIVYIASSTVIGILVYIFGFSPLVSTFAGLTLGGVSSAFTIPVIKQLNIAKRTFSLLTLESAFTDVYTLVFGLTVLAFFEVSTFSAQSIAITLISLFAIAALIGIVFGILWSLIVHKLLKEYNTFMVTLAVMVLVYTTTEFLGGNGAIAVLFFGLVLRNIRILIKHFNQITHTHKQSSIIVSNTETMFYSQLSFFVKTFFFVYIGVLLNVTSKRLLLLAVVLTAAIWAVRGLVTFFTKTIPDADQKLCQAIYARGLSGAILAQIAVTQQIPQAQEIASLVYLVIVASIIASSTHLYIVRKHYKSL